MSLRASWVTTLLSSLLSALVISVSPADGSSIQLSKSDAFSFAGASLVVANFDAGSSPDLAGIQGANALVQLNNGSAGFPVLRTFSLGAFSLAALGAADLDGDGRNDLVAVSSQPSLKVRLNAAGMLFGDVATTALPSRGRGIALGDLNGDERPDAVTALPDSGEIAICLNDGAGALGPPLVVPVGSTSGEPRIADLTGDGNPDVIVATFSPALAIWVIAGHGDGTFDAPAVAASQQEYQYSLVAADFDGDGRIDVGAVGDETVAIYWNQGGGTLSAPQTLTAGYLETFTPSGLRIAAGDMDRDGRLDLIVGGSGPLGFDHSNNYLAVFPQHGLRTFGPALQYRIGVFPKDVAVADLNADGWLDGVGTCSGLNELGFVSRPDLVAAAFVLRSAREAGLLSLLEVYEPVWLPARPAADSLPDLYGGHGGLLYRAHNLGHGLFAGAAVIGTGEPITARDLDGDGDEDLLIANGDSLAVRRNGLGGLDAPIALPNGLHVDGLADANDDGHVDLFASDASHRVRVLLGAGNGTFGPPQDTGVDVPTGPDGEWPTAARDLNGDGFADLLLAIAEAVEVDDEAPPSERYVHRLTLITRLGGGSGSFAPPESAQAVYRAEFVHHGGGGPIAFGDWNGDGVTDVACAAASCRSGNSTWFPVFTASVSGVLSALANVTAGSMCDLAAADLNGDHLDDIVHIVSPIGTTFAAVTLASDGLGGFSGWSWQMGDFPVRLAIADLDGDGAKDVITLNWKIPDYSRYSYSIRRNLTPQSQPTSVAVALVSSSFADGAVQLDWYAGGPGRFSGVIERRTSRSDWAALGTRASDADGHLRYADTDVRAGESYAYRLQMSALGGRVIASAWIAVPVRELQLAGAWPNPVVGRPTLVFTMAERGDVEMRLLDVAGRVVKRERISGLDPGSHRLRFGGEAPAPGRYIAQIEQGGHRREVPVTVLR